MNIEQTTGTFLAAVRNCPLVDWESCKGQNAANSKLALLIAMYERDDGEISVILDRNLAADNNFFDKIWPCFKTIDNPLLRGGNNPFERLHEKLAE
jgi:hypothetical protein